MKSDVNISTRKIKTRPFPRFQFACANELLSLPLLFTLPAVGAGPIQFHDQLWLQIFGERQPFLTDKSSLGERIATTI